MSAIGSICMWVYNHTYPAHIALMHAARSMKQNAFFNCANAQAKGLEVLANTVLVPVRYLFTGKTVTKIAPEGCTMEPSFDYSKDPHRKEMIKTILAVSTLPITLLIGGALKGLCFISPTVRANHKAIGDELRATKTAPRTVTKPPISCTPTPLARPKKQDALPVVLTSPNAPTLIIEEPLFTRYRSHSSLALWTTDGR